MPINMSYCRFENTLLALRECLEALENNEELSSYEEEAKEDLIRLCGEIYDGWGE